VLTPHDIPKTVTAFIGPSGCNNIAVLPIGSTIFDYVFRQKVFITGQDLYGPEIDLLWKGGGGQNGISKAEPFKKSFMTILPSLSPRSVLAVGATWRTLSSARCGKVLWGWGYDKLKVVSRYLRDNEVGLLLKIAKPRPDVVLMDESLCFTDPISTTVRSLILWAHVHTIGWSSMCTQAAGHIKWADDSLFSTKWFGRKW